MPRTGRNSDPLAEKELNKQSDSNERPSKGKKNKQPIMEQLGQTEDERRALRQQQRALQKDIAQSDGIENPESNGMNHRIVTWEPNSCSIFNH